MKTVALLLALAALPRLVHAEEAWRWTDAGGTTCYTNRAEVAPADATRVETRLVVETSRLPDAVTVADADAPLPPPRRTHKIYSDARRHFDCYAGGIVYSGGWGHADDVSGVGNCLPYMLGPEAWLNSARAELAMREHGIDWRDVVAMYTADVRAAAGPGPANAAFQAVGNYR